MFIDIFPSLLAVEEEAEAGHANGSTQHCPPHIRFLIGACYDKGMGVMQNHAAAVKRLRIAAKEGLPIAQYNLAVFLEQGSRGLTMNLREAVKLYHQAADQNFAGALYNLGVCYYYGEGIEMNVTEAVKLYEAAAAQGYALAQDALADCYLRGTGVTANEAEAERLLRLAAMQGNTTGIRHLAWYLKNIKGGNNLPEAFKLFQELLALDSDNKCAQYEIGHCYSHGLGVARDVIEAMRHFSKYERNLGSYDVVGFCDQVTALRDEYKTAVIIILVVVVVVVVVVHSLHYLHYCLHCMSKTCKLLLIIGVIFVTGRFGTIARAFCSSWRSVSSSTARRPLLRHHWPPPQPPPP
jgi:hypothetical protein